MNTPDTESEVKLLPCPFCGGKANIDRYGDASKSTQYSCEDCGASLETSEEFNHGGRWNERDTYWKERVERIKVTWDIETGGGDGNPYTQFCVLFTKFNKDGSYTILRKIDNNSSSEGTLDLGTLLDNLK